MCDLPFSNFKCSVKNMQTEQLPLLLQVISTQTPEIFILKSQLNEIDEMRSVFEELLM